MKTPPTSELEGLLQEARKTVSQARYDKATGRWVRVIWGLIAVVILTASLLGVYVDEIAVLMTGLGAICLGFVFCGILVFFLAFIPFPKDWTWDWRFTRGFHLVYVIFLVLTLVVFAVGGVLFVFYK